MTDPLITIRPAQVEDTATVAAILREAAQWLTDRGIPLWQTDELHPEHVAGDVAAGLFWLAWVGHDPAGCVRFQLEDALFWPDVPKGEAVYVHRLAVRRRFAGGRVSEALLTWAYQQAQTMRRRWLRLDTVADRPALRAVYERQGFGFHSERQVGPYLVARYQKAVIL